MNVIVVAVGLLCLLDLVLTAGVVRRLREHSAHLEKLLAGRTGPPGGELPVLAPGTAVAPLSGVTVEGEPVSTADLGDRALVAFFSPSCAPCRLIMPQFVERARRFGGRERTLAVLNVTGDEDASEYVRQLAPVARVVVERPDGAISEAMRVSAFPSVYLLDLTGDAPVVLAGGTDLSVVPDADPVAVR